jgi:hypothetical protein
MGIKLSNNAFGTLAASITSSATSITLTTGQGARFPTLAGGDYFYATLVDTSNNLEIVKCTARSTDVLTVVRAQESTTARAYSTGDRIEIRLTAQTFIDAVNEIGPTQVSDEANTSTGYFDLPSGTTAQRPASPSAGMIRHNSTTGYIEYWDVGSSNWIGLGAFQATGGTETSYSSGGVDYKVHTFTTSGSLSVSGAKSVDYLVVAGGGGGGPLGGGGGAGGYLSGSQTLTSGTYTVVIGAGANGGGPAIRGSNGGNTTALGLTAVGGGGGGAHDTGTVSVSGANGGSGGGGSDNSGSYGPGAGTSGQGIAGGNGTSSYTNPNRGGGGGGGAGGGGGDRSSNGAGGAGVLNAINGTSLYWAGGGGGGGYSGSGAGAGGIGGGGGGGTDGASGGAGGGSALNNGTSGPSTNNQPGGLGGQNTGGGGGAPSWSHNQSGTRSGGSGIVIIRYVI